LEANRNDTHELIERPQSDGREGRQAVDLASLVATKSVRFSLPTSIPIPYFVFFECGEPRRRRTRRVNEGQALARRVCDGLAVIGMAAGSIGASFAGMLLADSGAHVIKIEPPDGDRLRTHTPSGFLIWNRG